MNMRSSSNNYTTSNADRRDIGSSHERRSGRHAVLGKANSVDDISPRNIHSPRMTAPSPLARDYYTPTQQATNSDNSAANRNFFGTEIDDQNLQYNTGFIKNLG